MVGTPGEIIIEEVDGKVGGRTDEGEQLTLIGRVITFCLIQGLGVKGDRPFVDAVGLLEDGTYSYRGGISLEDKRHLGVGEFDDWGIEEGLTEGLERGDQVGGPVYGIRLTKGIEGDSILGKVGDKGTVIVTETEETQEGVSGFGEGPFSKDV